VTAASVRPRARRVARFDRTERVVHWCNATLFLTMIATGAALYAGPVSQLVGRRELVRTIHVYAGLLLPVPILIGIALRSGGQLRDDLGRLSRWDRDDRIWWRKAKRASAQLGKFNPGQKLNATFLGAAIIVMLATGSIMRWFEPFPVDWRTGATFVHDWFALGVGLAIFGHILLAVSDPDALRGIVRGWVPARWAKEKRPRWYAEVSGDGASAEAAGAGGAVGDVVAGAE
jgi:formate dehydrogenase subunit gamma